MNFSQVIEIFKAHFRLSVLVFIIGTSGVFAMSLLADKVYDATSTVVVDTRSSDPITGTFIQGVTSQTYMNTQIDIVKSIRTANKVLEILPDKLLEELSFNIKIERMDKEETTDTALAKVLLSNLTVIAQRENNLIKIRYTDEKPELSSIIANAFAEAYILVNVELKTNPAKQYSSFFDEQKIKAKERIKGAQELLTDYMTANNIINNSSTLEHEETRLNEISRQLNNVEAFLSEYKNKINNSNLALSNDVLANPLLNDLKSQAALLSAKLKENMTKLGSKHPNVLSQKAEFDNLKDEIRDQTKFITDSIINEYNLNIERQRDLEISLAEQKQRVIELKSKQSVVDLLQQDVEYAKASYADISARESKMNLESQSSLTNVSLLSKAIVPTVVSKPNVKMNIFVSVFIGAFLGLLSIIIRELVNRKIRVVDDIVNDCSLTLLGTVSSINAK